jgi:DNA primase
MTIVVCEGVTDVWRLGPGAVCTFGIKVTPSQIRLLSQYNKVIVFFDDDPQAILEAEKICFALAVLNTDCEYMYDSDRDPADFSQQEADHIIKEILQ